MTASFLQQLKTLLLRNLLLKKRNKKQLIQEIFFPIYFVAILAMTKALVKPVTLPPISSFPVNSINNASNGFQFNTTKKVLVTPNTTEVQVLMADVVNMLGIQYEFYSNLTQMEAEYMKNNKDISAGIIFNYQTDNIMSYALRFDNTKTKDTDLYAVSTSDCRTDPTGVSDRQCRVNNYLTSGFIWLQNAVETALIRHNLSSTTLELPDVSVQLMPKGPFTSDLSYIQIISSIYFVFAYGFFINFLTTNIVAEKEKKIREGMRMMGLRDAAFWLSWGLTYAVIILIVTLILCLISYASSFFQYSNIFLLFVILYLYGLSIITFSFMLSPFFNKAKVAGTVASFSTLILSTLYLAVSITRTVTPDGYTYAVGAGGRYALCLISPVALALAIDQALFLDVAKNGMSFDTISLGEFPLYAPVIMLIVDFILYGLLAIYLDHVIPGEYGVRYKPWYFLLPSYWCNKRKSGEMTSLIDNQHLQHPNKHQNEDVEMVSRALENKAALKIYNIRKTFKNSDKEDVHAVDGISLEFYEGQITGLLGHNGAGKTTLINMLCGLTAPSAGGAEINGLDITDINDMAKIRATAGICPQHNILYDELSCREHLQVFAGIKGVPPHKIHDEIEKSLADVDLTDQAEVFSKDLSGGQKRKLSVAIALIGDPKIIILDEPTAGMDPYSRRHLWSLLKKNKEGKVILLTTHFMDEADILADRKAIISKGQLRCCGSSLFLKSRFGIGYHLNMVVEPNADSGEITKLLASKVDGVEEKRSHGKELAYTIPLSEIDKFSGMFSALEQKDGSGQSQAERLGIKSYGVSMTTLEEVFLNLGSIEEMDAKDVTENGHTNGGLDDVSLVINSNSADVDNKSMTLNSGKELQSQRLKALLKLRLLIQIRSKVGLIFQLIIPIVLVVASVVLYKVNQTTPTDDTPKPFELRSFYAKSRSKPSLDPNFLFLDSLNNTASQSIYNQLNNNVYVDDIFNETVNLMSIAPHYIGINLEDYSPGNTINYTSLYNDTAYLSLPVITNMISNALLGSNGITLYSLPWPALTNTLKYDGNTFSNILILGLAFVILLAGFASNVVRDKQFKTRSQLRVSGITFNMYWGSSFLFDICLFLIPATICIIIVLAVQLPSLSPGGAIFSLILLFIVFIPANLMLAYCFSFLFDTYETCIAVLPNLFIFCGLLPYMAVSLIDMITRGDVGIYLHYVFCCIDPPYVIFGGLYFIDKVFRIASFTDSTGAITFGDYFKGDSHVIFPIIAPILHFVGLYFLIKMLDIRSNGGDVRDVCRKEVDINKVVPEDNPDSVENEDEDVKAERDNVALIERQGNNTSSAVAYVSNLRKEFKKRGKSEYKGCQKVQKEDEIKVAVRNATLSVKAGEVFGLLGPNGAGKTTLMNMIIAEVGQTRGKVVLNGHNIQSNISEAFQGLGYCPQHDALWEYITIQEHLELYAAVKGVPSHRIPSLINFYMDSLKIMEHAKKNTKKCSGGTKRKLSYAMSVIANSNVVLMDEPSTGMDPESKRFLWDTISSSFTGTQKGAILTTHYMEEADALCNRLAIMVNGKIECLGPSQHLKDKFGSGYQLEIKLQLCPDIESKMDQLEEHLKTGFPNIICAERFGDRGQYKIPRDDVKSLGEAFAFLEKTKEVKDLEEYSFSQSTLEQVFLEFAKRQKDEEAEKSDKAKLKRQQSQVSQQNDVAV